MLNATGKRAPSPKKQKAAPAFGGDSDQRHLRAAGLESPAETHGIKPRIQLGGGQLGTALDGYIAAQLGALDVEVKVHAVAEINIEPGLRGQADTIVFQVEIAASTAVGTDSL